MCNIGCLVDLAEHIFLSEPVKRSVTASFMQLTDSAHWRSDTRFLRHIPL